MANAVVTSSTKYVKVVFNDMSTSAGRTIAYFSKEHIAEVYTPGCDCYVVIKLDDGAIWDVSLTGNDNTLMIDTVAGATPSDNADLCDKIAALIDY